MEFTTKQLARLMLDNAKGNVSMPANFSEGEVRTPDEAISDAFLQVMGLTKEATVKDVQLAFRKEEVRLGVFAIIEEVLREGIVTEAWRRPFFDQFVETKSQARGDQIKFYIESRQELVVSRVSKDGKVSLDRQRFSEGDELDVKVQTYAIKVYEHLARIILGRADWGKLVMHLQEAVEKAIADHVYEAFAGMVAKVPAAFKYEGSYDKDAVLKAIRNVKMASGATGVILVGTELALSKLQDATVMNDDRKNDLYNTGKLTMFFGNPLMELPQAIKQGGFKADAPELLMKDDEIFIIPDNVGKPVKQVVEPELIDLNESGVRVDDTIE